MVMQGCKKDKEDEVVPKTQTDLLVGDWEVTEIGSNDFTGYDYSYLFKFKSSGDWQFCYEYDTDATKNDCYNGKWKWEDSNEKTVIIDQFSSNDLGNEWKLDVTVLDETKLEGSITSTYDDGYDTDSYTQTIKFVKIN